MQPTPLLTYLQLIEKNADRNRKSRQEREIENLLREAEFARQPTVTIEPPAHRLRLRQLAISLRAFLF